MIPFGADPVDADLRKGLLEAADELMRLTGAELCDWNKTIDVHGMVDEEGDPAALGIARWNGTISLRTDVLATLRQLWQQRSPREWSNEEFKGQQVGVLTVTHELAHYLVAAGDRYPDGKPFYDEFPGRALEEGLTELAGRRYVGVFAEAESRSPGVTSLQRPRSYPQFAPAAQAIVQHVSRLRGESQDAVLNALVRENVPGKYRKLSQMVLEAAGPWDQVPPAERSAACAPIINSVWSVFNANRDWAAAKPQDRPTLAPEARSWIMGLQLVAATERGRLQVIDRYRPGELDSPWRVAAAKYELDLAGDAVNFTQSTKHPDVRAAATGWMQRAIRRMEDASRELDPPDPSTSGDAGPSHTSVTQPEVAAVLSLAESARRVRPRRAPRFGVHRQPGGSDAGRDR